MSDDVRFDPRFDPAFQPGYEGPLTPAATPRAPAAPMIGAPPRETPGNQQQARAITPPQPGPEPEDDQRARGWNPFLIALGAVAVVLTGSGLYLLSRIQELFAQTQSSNNLDFVVMQVLMGLTPLLIVLGLATAIGLVFVLAVRWKRR